MNFDDDFGSDFNALFNLVWNRFNAPVKDMQPYRAYVVEGKGLEIVCKTIGINKEDISVRLDKEKGAGYPTLKIQGSTEDKQIHFTNKVDLTIQLKVDADKIESVQYDSKNGLTTIYIKIKQEPKKSIEAKRIDDSADIDW